LVALATGLCYVGLVLTCSLGGYLSSAVSLIVFGLLTLIILRRMEVRLFRTLCTIYLIGTVIIGSVGGIIVPKSDLIMNRVQNNSYDSTNVRLDMWHAALEQWKLRPFFGTGSGTYL